MRLGIFEDTHPAFNIISTPCQFNKDKCYSIGTIHTAVTGNVSQSHWFLNIPHTNNKHSSNLCSNSAVHTKNSVQPGRTSSIWNIHDRALIFNFKFLIPGSKINLFYYTAQRSTENYWELSRDLCRIFWVIYESGFITRLSLVQYMIIDEWLALR